MIRKDLFKTIDLVAEEKELTKEQVTDAFVQGMIAGCKRAHDVKTCHVVLKEDKNQIFVYKQRLVVEDEQKEVDKTYTTIPHALAKEIKPRIKVGDFLEEEINPEEFGHYAVRDFKNKINEVLVHAQKNNLFNYFKQYEHQMYKARVIDVTDEFYRLDLGKDMTTLLPKKEALAKDNFHIGDWIQVYVTAVELKTKWPKVFVSRTAKELVEKLLELHIPEIKEGVIEVVGSARDANDRSKIGVRSNDPNVDPIGACVGKDGSRIREVVKDLSDEKIDLFRWSDNERELIKNALQPAEVIAITDINPKEKSALAIVPDSQLSLAIGRLGQNVKLAVQATGWSIDIKSETMAQNDGILY